MCSAWRTPPSVVTSSERRRRNWRRCTSGPPSKPIDAHRPRYGLNRSAARPASNAAAPDTPNENRPGRVARKPAGRQGEYRDLRDSCPTAARRFRSVSLDPARSFAKSEVVHPSHRARAGTRTIDPKNASGDRATTRESSRTTTWSAPTVCRKRCASGPSSTARHQHFPGAPGGRAGGRGRHRHDWPAAELTSGGNPDDMCGGPIEVQPPPPRETVGGTWASSRSGTTGMPRTLHEKFSVSVVIIRLATV